jgi:hypothetical protein
MTSELCMKKFNSCKNICTESMLKKLEIHVGIRPDRIPPPIKTIKYQTYTDTRQLRRFL